MTRNSENTLNVLAQTSDFLAVIEELKTNNDQRVWTELYQMLRPYAFKILSAFSDLNGDDREDIFHDLIVNIKRAIELDQNEFTKGWIVKVLKNAVYSLHRKSVRSPLLVSNDAGESASSILSVAYEPPEAAENHAVTDLRIFVRSLPDIYRLVILLHLDGNAHAEIAKSLEVSEDCVKTRFSRAKIMLRNLVP